MGLLDNLFGSKKDRFEQFEHDSARVVDEIFNLSVNALGLLIGSHCPETYNTMDARIRGVICFAGVMSGAMMQHPKATSGQVQIISTMMTNYENAEALIQDCMQYFMNRTRRIPLDVYSAESGMSILECIQVLCAEWVVRKLIGGGYELSRLPLNGVRFEGVKFAASVIAVAGEKLGSVLS